MYRIWPNPRTPLLARLTPAVVSASYATSTFFLDRNSGFIASCSKTFCNPGSVGQPRDGDPRAAYALLDGGQIISRRIPYDITKTQHAMIAAGFPKYSYANLSIGAQVGGRIDSIQPLTLGND